MRTLDRLRHLGRCRGGADRSLKRGPAYTEPVVCAVWGLVLVLSACTVRPPQRDMHSDQERDPIYSLAPSAPRIESSFHDSGIDVQTFHGPVRLIGLFDSDDAIDTAFDRSIDDTDSSHSTDACSELPALNSRRGE